MNARRATSPALRIKPEFDTLLIRGQPRSQSEKVIRCTDAKLQEDSICTALFFFPGITPAGESIFEQAIQRVTLTSVLKYLLSARFKVCLLLCGAMFTMAFMSVIMGMSIICMTVPPQSDAMKISDALFNRSNLTIDDAIVRGMGSFLNQSKSVGTKPCEGTLDWSSTVQGMVLSSLSWGRLFTPVAGLLSDKCNIKLLIALGVTTASTATAFIPFASSISVYIVIALRIATGLCDAVVQPSVNRFIVSWFPTAERNLALSIATGGRQIAVLIAFPLAGLLCMKCDWLGGWPIVFYVPVAYLVFWCPAWILFASQNPAKVRKITLSEKKYIASDTVVRNCKEKVSTPWCSLLLSSAVWANIAAIMCHEIPMCIIFTFLPAFMRDILKFPSGINGVLSSLPAAAFLVSKLLASYASDALQHNFPHISRTTFAKIFNAIASLGMGSCLTAVSFMTERTRTVALVLLVIGVAFGGLHTPGCVSTLVSIGPRFAGTLAGIAFFIFGITFLLIPLIVKAIITTGSQQQWMVVLMGTGSIALLPLIFFTLFGSADAQKWATNRIVW